MNLTAAKPSENTRRKILQAAFEEFYKNGFQGGSINRIVDQAGTTKAADVKELFESSKFKFPPLLMWTKHGWTESSHFPKPPAIDFGAIKPGPLVDGMFKGD